MRLRLYHLAVVKSFVALVTGMRIYTVNFKRISSGMYRTLTLAIFFNISVTSSMRPCDSNQRIDSGKKLKNSQDRRVIITVKYFMQAKAVVIKL